MRVEAGDIYCTLQADIMVTIMVAKGVCPRQVSRRRSDKALRLVCREIIFHMPCFSLATFPMCSREWCSRAQFSIAKLCSTGLLCDDESHGPETLENFHS